MSIKMIAAFAAGMTLVLTGANASFAASMHEKYVTVGGAPMYPSKNIIQNAVNSKDHTTLVAAVKAAGLVDVLSSPGPFTVFAPTNAAFAKLPKGLLEKLLLPANKAVLVKILTYHVVAGKVMAADVMAGDVATVIATDVAASNGVIHVIDTVLVPSDVNIAKL